MSTIIMNMAIPNKATNYGPKKDLANKHPKMRLPKNIISPTRRRPSCSLQLSSVVDADHQRRSGNYKPTLWDFDRIQSLNSVYTEEKYSRRVVELVAQVKKLLLQESNWFQQLELIDELQKLGVSYRFNDEINQIMNHIYLEHKYRNNSERDLYSTALAFRLLRQHGLKVSQDVFDCFKNEEGEFEPSLGDNAEGVLQLYEASFLLTEAKRVSSKREYFPPIFYRKKLNDGVMDEHLSSLVRRSLELPLHWCVQKPNARWFVDAYAKRGDVNPIISPRAKAVSRWWKETELAEKLPFARDRVVENYIWNLGVLFEPQYGYSRIMSTKLKKVVFLCIK
uniref:Monoterpene synthase 3 n=1 Tax=Salvia fruticosa TaxID=268906 RepID=C0KL20_SALFT|nr:monoterpene synthase 3 [Salvia fruticosa]